MGAGIAYQYTHHVLVDYYGLTAQCDEDGNPVEPLDYDEDQAQQDWDNFLENVVAAFDAWELGGRPSAGSTSYHFAETDRLYIGVDYGGADSTSCIFLEPKTYQRGTNWYEAEEIDYNLNRDAERGFNKLIRMYEGSGLLMYWTTAWTASPYGLANGKWVLYGRKS